jgi:alcohol dehydrogenase
MKALVYNGVGKIALEDRPKPEVLNPSDVVVKLTRTTICGSDLHIIQGHVPTVAPGRVIGHEGVGIVESVGKDVQNFKPGDHVLIACITSCATCHFCKKGSFGLCNRDGGWRLGHLDDGTQAEYVRIPHADASLHPVPDGIDERSLLVLSDIIVKFLLLSHTPIPVPPADKILSLLV